MDADESTDGIVRSGVDFTLKSMGGWSRHSWMRDNASHLEGYSLTQVCIPGAHNAATHAVKPFSAFGCDAPGLLRGNGALSKSVRFFARSTTANWARCQSLSIYEQLKFGVRYFDIRLAPNPQKGGALYVTHSLLSDSLAAVLEDVNRFCGEESSSDEFVILDFQSIFVETEEELKRTLFPALATIHDRCLPNCVSLATPLGTLWSRSETERIVVVADRVSALAEHPRVFPRKLFIVSRWKNKQDTRTLLQAFEKEVSEQCTCECRARPESINVVQAVLTPGTSEVVRGMFIHYKPTLRHVAFATNPRLLEWFRDWATQRAVGGRTLPWREGLYRNVMMIDFVEEGRVDVSVNRATTAVDLVELCVYLNRLRHLVSP